jgi:hypothetical protein
MDAAGEGGRGVMKRLELLATVLLAMAAVATAWSSYQATRWNGEQAKAASQTNGIRIDAANAHDDADLAEFYEARFRDEFQPAFDAWLATDPLLNRDAPATPFAMPEYQLESQTEADRLDQQGEASAAAVRRDIVRASNYVLGVVLFAVALFFAGISTKLASDRLRLVTLVVGYTVFLGTVVWMATFPISFVT